MLKISISACWPVLLPSASLTRAHTRARMHRRKPTHTRTQPHVQNTRICLCPQEELTSQKGEKALLETRLSTAQAAQSEKETEYERVVAQVDEKGGLQGIT